MELLAVLELATVSCDAVSRYTMSDTVIETIELFPLSTVLLPGGRLSLQIFEPRYIDLVSRSMKHQTGFGLLWLRAGSEVIRPESSDDSQFARIGTYARIVAWDSLPNGLLGITIEGEKRFQLLSSSQRTDHLHIGEVQWLAPEPPLPLPAGCEELQAMLMHLLDHPHLQRLQINPIIDDVARLVNLLVQFLPLPEAEKFILLSVDDPLQRLASLEALLDQLSH